MIRSLYFHNPNKEGFEKIIKFLFNRHYKFINLTELHQIISSDWSSQKKSKLVFVSFDDGWKSNLELLPIIEKYHVPITIFVTVESIFSGNYWWEYVAKDKGYKSLYSFKKLSYDSFNSELNKIKQKIGKLERSCVTLDELKNLSKHSLVTIQSHTVNHPILTVVPIDVLDMELQASKDFFEKELGIKIIAFSYPNGSLTQREIDYVKKYYNLAFTTEQNNITPNCDKYLLPRYALTGSYFRDLLKIYGLWKILKKIF